MQKTQIVINGSKEKPISIDISFKKTNQLKPIVIFCHGFKGFKDWGHFNLIADEFVKQDFVFVKFNFSYNGTTLDNPVDFADLDTFGNNNFSTELDDAGIVINYMESNAVQYEGNENEIYLIGHSRGGGIAILKTNEDSRIQKLATWASVKDVADFFINQDLDKWKADGLIYTLNARTQQKMPLYYQVYEDFIKNKDRLDIPKAAASIDIPWLIVHGTNDTSVPYDFAEKIHDWCKNSELCTIENADHTFGGKHPWNEDELPADSKILTEKTIAFFNQ
ncbi:MAG: alpha/beta hydrolase [Sphingobacteriales bacterium]|nr:alpha/beta hydrolase [Sphingobacteriales bacterium]